MKYIRVKKLLSLFLAISVGMQSLPAIAQAAGNGSEIVQEIKTEEQGEKEAGEQETGQSEKSPLPGYGKTGGATPDLEVDEGFTGSENIYDSEKGPSFQST